MSNPRFYPGSLAGNVYTMSLTEDADYPLSNLSTYIASDEWRSSAATDAQTLNIDLGSAKAIDSLILHNHNIDDMAVTALQVDSADNPAFTDPVDVIAEMQVESPTGLIDLFAFAAVTKRYWRILFSNASGQTPRIGQLFLSGKFDIGFTYNYGFRGGNKNYDTAVSSSLSGVERASQVADGKTIFEFDFSLGSETFRTNWIAFHDAVRGRFYPFYFADIDDVVRYVKFDKDYNPAETVRYQKNSVQLVRLIEQ